MILSMRRDKLTPAFDFAPIWRAIRGAVWEIEARQKLAAYEADMEAMRLASRNYIPVVSVREYTAGKFLCVNEQEIPLVGIVDIVANSYFRAPGLTFQYPAPEDPALSSDEKAASKAYLDFKSGPTSIYNARQRTAPKKPFAYPCVTSAAVTIHLLSNRKIAVRCSAFEVDILCARMIDAWKHGK